MSKEIYISSTPHETRLAIVEDEALTEIYYERENEYTLAGSIYNGRVTRVLPGMQSSFVDIGLERDAFLYITDFMEETPDPEEFDTASASDRAPRPITGGGERSSEGSRGSDRGDRGGKGRRGGPRDRNQDRQGGSDLGPRQPGAEREQSDRNLPLAAEPGVPAGDSNEASEIGEGAPGADGSRRWRGRRGRRRGRGPGTQPGDQPQENSAPVYPTSDSSFDEEPYIEIDGATAQPPAELADESQRNEHSGDRGRRDDRGGRRRDGQRFDGPRRDQGQPPRQAPRGFTPSRDLYGMDSGETSSTGPIANAYPDSDAGPVAEPLILPGESLSKYRKSDEPEAPSAAPALPTTSVTLAPPANLYTLAEGWDGGAVLPGETIRRRSETKPEPRSEGRGGSRRDRDFDREPRRENRSERSTPAVAPVIEQQASAPAAEPVPEPSFIPAPEAIEAPAPVTAEEVVETAPEAQHQPAEYEPSDASASYRVDPLLRSEYRQSAPVLEPPAEIAAEPAAQVAETAPVEEAAVPNLAHSFTPAPDQWAEKLHSDVQPEPEELPSPAVEPHDITAISATGEMHSEPAEVLTEVPAHPTPMEVPEPASPIRHEGAVMSDDSTSEFPAPAAASFAPGTGQLDEEVLEEDDLEGSTFHASSIEEMEDLDEETLEGAADLGTMLREMSIDQITRTAPEIEEQDDVEEDDFEEDDLDEDELEEQEADELESELEQSGDDLQEQAARTGTAADQEFFEEQFGQNREENRNETGEALTPGSQPQRRDSFREGDRRGGRRDGRRDGRRGRSDRGDRSSSSSERERSGHGNGRGRHSMQSTNLPAISDLLKPGQEILVQIAKEPIAKKGARITSHIALPGRFLVFMPTVNHTGVSRKIESDGERRRLKEILLSEKGDATGGFIVRTAAEGASEEELRSDLRFLLNLWADIKARSESSKSPALIYHDLNLIERILRDQVTDNFSAIWVDSETEYERVLRFLQRFQPSLIRRVKLYSKDTPLFEQFGITEEINKALRSKVWLKSGGSIVINQTEALVAIDINTGKFVGKTARLEDTIVKTNLDAIPEIVRQIRLRDLGGIIIIDFIDMDERKNRNRVMAALEEELKSDRAPSKVLQFNDFGLVAITRKRVKQSLERTLSTTCGVCQGTGMVKSPITVCNDIYIEIRKMHKHLDRGDVMLRVHPEVVKQLKSSGAKWLQEMEEMVGKTILVKSDPGLHPEQFDIH
jgi:ribonuclease E